MTNQSKKLLKNFLLLFICSCFLSLHEEMRAVTRNTDSFNSRSCFSEEKTPTEKIYIHFDRSTYFLGDTIWFKVYLLDGSTNMPNAFSKVVYVELIDQSGQIVKSRTIQMNNGGGEGEFDLGIDMSKGIYTIRSYTNYMRNFDASFFFRKEIYVDSYNELKNDSVVHEEFENKAVDSTENTALPKPDIQFFPEGGYMVARLPARLGFKAIDHSGKSIDVSGVILDSDDHELISFSSLRLGMGSFTIVPKDTRPLKARIYHGGEELIYELPEIQEQGVIMRVIHRVDSYQIRLQSSLKIGVDGLELIGQQRGKVVCKASLKGTQDQGTIKVPITNLDDGIVKFTLYNNKKEPLCERLVFLEKNIEKPTVGIESDKPDYRTRSLVELEISLKNSLKMPANVSIAVTDKATNVKLGCGSDILTYLLLNSEVKGEIEDACYYFNSTDPQRKRVLDLLLLTQGYRNYLWNAIGKENTNDFEYSFETGVDFKGSVRSVYNNEIPVHSDLVLTYKNRSVFGQDHGKTVGEGEFNFPGYIFKDSTSIIIEARKRQHKKNKNATASKDFYIQMDSKTKPDVKVRSNQHTITESEINAISEMTYDTEYLDELYADQPDFEQLDNVDIQMQAKKKAQVERYQRQDMRYTQPQRRVDYEKENVVALGGDLFWAFFNRTPGITYATGGGFAGGSGTESGYFYRGSKIVFFLNGVRFPNAGSISDLVNANDVSFIDLVTGIQAVSYSVQVAVIVYTKSSDEGDYGENRKNQGVVNFIYPGLYKPQKFYTPLYTSDDNSDQTQSDNRITLHWEPSLRLNPNSKAKISFYTADPESDYRVELEGITLDGQPVRQEAFFEVVN